MRKKLLSDSVSRHFLPRTLSTDYHRALALEAPVLTMLHQPRPPLRSPGGTAVSETARNAPIGAIVGGVVGGLAILAALACFIVLMVLKQRTRGSKKSLEGESGGARTNPGEYAISTKSDDPKHLSESASPTTYMSPISAVPTEMGDTSPVAPSRTIERFGNGGFSILVRDQPEVAELGSSAEGVEEQQRRSV